MATKITTPAVPAQPIVNQYQAQLSATNAATDRYINDLLSTVNGNKDEAIRLLTKDHELALGTNDTERAKFLETVSDSLETKIGRIPYDYQVATGRTNQDLATTTSLTNRNKEQALARLSEDEKVWKDQFGVQSTEARGTQQEQLAQRGILTGTRANAQGLAGSEVGKLETELSNTLNAYNRALGRNQFDVNQTASDTLTQAQTGATRTLEDLKTAARRGGINAETTFTEGKTAAERAAEAQKKALEAQRSLAKLQNQTYAQTGLA